MSENPLQTTTDCIRQLHLVLDCLDQASARCNRQTAPTIGVAAAQIQHALELLEQAEPAQP